MRFYIEAEALNGAQQIHWAKDEIEVLALVTRLLREQAAVRVMEALPETEAA